MLSIRNNQNSFVLKQLVFFVLSKWFILAITTVLCMLFSLIYSYLIVTPLYVSNGKIYITNKNSETLTTSELSISSYLTNDYENLIVDHAVLDEVSKKLNYKYNYNQLRNYVTVENPINTRFLEIVAKTPSPEDSKLIVDSICEISQKKIVELLGIDRVTIIRNGSLPKVPSTPNVSKNLSLSFLIGFIASGVILFIIYVLNDKITTSEDVENYLELSVLGNIPYSKNPLSEKK